MECGFKSGIVHQYNITYMNTRKTHLGSSIRPAWVWFSIRWLSTHGLDGYKTISLIGPEYNEHRIGR